MNGEVLKRFKSAVERSFPFFDDESFDDYIARARKLLLGQRAMIAAIMNRTSRDLRRERQPEKTAWIAAARLSFDPGPRQPCDICVKYKRVAQAHHVIPLNWQFDRGMTNPDHTHVWLCPTHHAIMHLMIDTDDTQLLGRRAAQIIDELSPDEYTKFVNLLCRSGSRRR
jgi:hypothetical protein